MQEERRKHTRYSQAGLSITGLSIHCARTGFSGFLKLDPDTQCLDFCVSGMRFCSDQLFQIGEKLVFDLAVQDIDLSEIPAAVVHSTEAEDGGTFCTGVIFCFDSGRMHKPEITHDLLRIESQLRVATEFPT